MNDIDQYDVREWRDAYLCRQEDAVRSHGWCSCAICPRCTANFLAVDAASIRLDLAVARQYAGRYPRLWSREIPLS